MGDNDRRRTSIPVYGDELEILKEAKRTMAYERGEDLALHDFLVTLAQEYLDENKSTGDTDGGDSGAKSTKEE